MKVLLTDNQFSNRSSWSTKLEDKIANRILLNRHSVDLFDQNGYHMTDVEQAYCMAAGIALNSRRQEHLLYSPWMKSNARSNSHFNHCELFERKNFAGDALAQLKKYAVSNPMLWKLIKMKPKWGIDVSIDYVDDTGKVFEVFHYEWDSFCYEEINRKKKEIEEFVLSKDWDSIAQDLWELRDEWINLEFFEQSSWKTKYYGISEERFKNIVWESSY